MLAITYQLFAILCGWLEAVLYARRGAEAFTGNEHTGMMLQRIAAWLLVPVSLLAQHWIGEWALVEIVPAGLLFPLFHDEAYNFTRLWIDKRAQLNTGLGILAPEATRDKLAWHQAWAAYAYGYQSPTTTARNDFNGTQRTWLALGGLLVLIAGYWLLLK
ncbi:hypothetical protein FNT36_03305 [Hymenobacter setariae]|uniref:Uncharacterized protein n=1 Tax=Hymenobacter setariae TaxID=2594794 RepID=A0A558C336_9BACT|nr:hypothetical protein [Hymenobacter setariae]TVT43134.1 hypothetical protein FNT36_03305 [Hymenobacter setariae]